MTDPSSADRCRACRGAHAEPDCKWLAACLRDGDSEGAWLEQRAEEADRLDAFLAPLADPTEQFDRDGIVLAAVTKEQTFLPATAGGRSVVVRDGIFHSQEQP